MKDNRRAIHTDLFPDLTGEYFYFTGRREVLAQISHAACSLARDGSLFSALLHCVIMQAGMSGESRELDDFVRKVFKKLEGMEVRDSVELNFLIRKTAREMIKDLL